MISFKPSAIIFGIPDPLPVIPGFAVEAKDGDYLLAVDGDNRFYVERVEGGFALMPQVMMPSGRMGVDTRKTFFVPSP